MFGANVWLSGGDSPVVARFVSHVLNLSFSYTSYKLSNVAIIIELVGVKLSEDSVMCLARECWWSPRMGQGSEHVVDVMVLNCLPSCGRSNS
jgi:hypothetical protein